MVTDRASPLPTMEDGRDISSLTIVDPEALRRAARSNSLFGVRGYPFEEDGMALKCGE